MEVLVYIAFAALTVVWVVIKEANDDDYL
jgi:hypothetical protein